MIVDPTKRSHYSCLKVFNNIEEEQKTQKLKESMTKYQLLASAIEGNPQKPRNPHPHPLGIQTYRTTSLLGACFKCGSGQINALTPSPHQALVPNAVKPDIGR